MLTVRPSNNPTAGPDRRVDAYDASQHDFASTVWTRGPESARPTHPSVEVQAFRPDTSGGEKWQRAIVSLVIHAVDGMADVMLSSSEARAFAESIILAANEADTLTAAANA